MKRIIALLLLLLVSPVAAYPTIVVSAPGSEYVATSAVNTNNYRNYQSTTYDYVDGYNAGYTTATRDSYLYSRRTYRDEVRFVVPYSRVGGNQYYFSDSPRTAYITPGQNCDFGRSDICLNRYERCGDYYCRVGDSDYRQYTYYNPYSVPGLYPLSDRNGIYYVN